MTLHTRLTEVADRLRDLQHDGSEIARLRTDDSLEIAVFGRQSLLAVSAAILRAAAAEVQRLTDERDEAVRLWEGRIEESRNKNQQIVLGDKAWKVRIASVRQERDALRALLDEAPLCHMNGYNGVRCCDVHDFREKVRALSASEKEQTV